MENLNKIFGILNERFPDSKPLFICKYGSHLYGTNTEISDTDYKCVFAPSLNSLLWNNKIKRTEYSTGKNNSKNDNDDIDIGFWSIQYFLKSVNAGDTNAIDVLFAPSFLDNVLYMDNQFKVLFDNHLKLFNICTSKGYLGYSIGQAKKYGIKSSRLGIIKQVKEYVETLTIEDSDCLSKHRKDIIKKFYDKSFCFELTKNNSIFLMICNKMYQDNIKMNHFKTLITETYNTYGGRARLAEQNKGLDYKALSHAVRALIQMEELLIYGKITFPLTNITDIMDIKNGKLEWKDIESKIINLIKRVDNLTETTYIKSGFEETFVTEVLKNIYNL